MEVSKKELKEVVLEAIEPFAKSVQQDFQKVHQRLDAVESDLSEVKSEVREMKANSGEIFNKIDNFTSMYEKQDQELAVFGGQINRVVEQTTQLDSRVTKLEFKIK